MKRYLVSALALTVCLIGSGPSFAQVEAASHKTKIFISPEVPKPADMFYYGPGAALGLVGYLATNGDKGPKDLLKMVMEKENISITDIVLAETKSQIAALDKFELVDSDTKEGLIKLEISIYGFNKKMAFGSNTYPVVKVAMTYQNDKGDVIWKDSDFVTANASNSDQGFTLDAYLAEPEKIRSGLTRVAQLSVSGLVKSLQKKISK